MSDKLKITLEHNGKKVTRTISVVNTSAGDLQYITFENFVKNVVKTKEMYATVEEFTIIKDSRLPNPKEINNPADATYDRRTIPIGTITTEYFKNQVLEQITDNGAFTTVESDDFLEAVQGAAVRSLENFGSPSYLVDFGDSTFGIFSGDKNDFVISKFSQAVKNAPGKGAIICFRPGCNLIFKFKKVSKELEKTQSAPK